MLLMEEGIRSGLLMRDAPQVTRDAHAMKPRDLAAEQQDQRREVPPGRRSHLHKKPRARPEAGQAEATRIARLRSGLVTALFWALRH